MKDSTFYKAYFQSPVGRLTLVCDTDKNLVCVAFENQKYFCESLGSNIVIQDNELMLSNVINWLKEYFDNKRPDIYKLKLNPSGTEFRKEVWKLLLEIPYGEVTTYGEIAKKIALKMNIKKMSSQAVGGAISHNPISIIIPCHRVIGANGKLVGYAGGVENKIKLLRHEGVKTLEKLAVIN